MATKSNPVLMWIAIAVAIVLIVLLVKSFSGGDAEYASSDTAVSDEQLQQDLAELNIDADSPNQTIRTLVAQMKAQNQKTEAILEENQRLTQENLNNDKKIAQQVKIQSRQIRNDVQNESSHILGSLTQRVNELTSMLNTNQTINSNGSATGMSNQGDIPVGLGFDEGFTNVSYDGWILPLDLPRPNDEGKIILNRPGSTADELFNDVNDPANQAVAEAKIPWYTVPENATLLGSVSMTGMIGRIPVNGEVIDPYPFKIIVGSDNLATNGHYIPGLKDMMFSGIATGDLLLSCVRATLYSVTYTFYDGTVYTQRATEGGEMDLESDSTGFPRRGLGWLSDEWGNPCLKGQLITNAPTFLLAQFGLSAAEGGARAYAENETTSVVTTSGAITTATTGDAVDRAVGEAGAEGFGSAREWLNERQGSSFDAIYLRSGTRTEIHIETQLTIDYDPKGRKLAYDHQKRPGYTSELD